jgi:hypothetical protein
MDVAKNSKADENIVTFPTIDDDIIKDILKNIHKKLSKEKIEFLTNISSCNLKMAELLSDSSDLDFSGIIPKDTLDKEAERNRRNK